MANVPAIPDNPEALQISLSINGEELEIQDYSELMGIIAFTFCVPENVIDEDCPASIWVGEGECGQYQFEFGGFQPGENVTWYLGENTLENQGHFLSFYQFEESGSQPVCAYYTSELCPAGAEACVIVDVDLCEPACPEAIQVIQQDCNSYVFYLTNVPPVGVTWNFGDGVTQNAGIEVQHNFESNGVYIVSATLETPNCPQGITLFYTVQVDCTAGTNCPEILEVVNPECGTYVIHVAGSWPNEENTAWYINGSSLAAGIGSSFEFVPEESGQYTITAQYAGQPCNDQIFLTALIQFDGCSDDCTIELVPVYLGNGWWEFTAYGNPEEYPMWWSVDGGEPAAATWVYMIQLEPGTHVICATIEPESCPEPVSDCIEVVEEGDEDCTVVMLGMDSYVLQGGPNFIGWTIYDINDNAVATGSSEYSNDDPFYDFSVCLDDGCYVLLACGGVPLNEENFDFFIGETAELIFIEPVAEPGECFGMIAYFSVNSDCGEEECTENEIELSIVGQYDNPNMGDLIELALSLDGVELNGFEIPLSADINATSTFCVPDGCYTLEVSSAIPILAQFITISATVNGEPVDVEQLLQGGTSLEFQVGAGVDCTDGVNDLSEGEFLLYPNPALDILTVQRSSSEIEVLTVFDGAGRVVMQQSLNSAVEHVNLNELAPGMYVARTGNFTHPLLIIR
jgi:hypothetical protein